MHNQSYQHRKGVMYSVQYSDDGGKTFTKGNVETVTDNNVSLRLISRVRAGERDPRETHGSREYSLQPVVWDRPEDYSTRPTDW